MNIHSGRLPSANSPHFCLRSYWVSFPELMSHRSASPVCATGSSRMGPGQLLWDVVLQVPLSWRRIGLSLGTCYRPLPRDMYPIRSSARSAGISSFLACCSRPVSGRSLSMDLLLDHISLLPYFSTLLHDDMLLALAFHSCPLTLFPADSCCMVCGIYL